VILVGNLRYVPDLVCIFDAWKKLLLHSSWNLWL